MTLLVRSHLSHGVIRRERREPNARRDPPRPIPSFTVLVRHRLASLAPDDTELEMTTDKESHIATAPGCGMHQDGGWNEFWD